MMSNSRRAYGSLTILAAVPLVLPAHPLTRRTATPSPQRRCRTEARGRVVPLAEVEHFT